MKRFMQVAVVVLLALALVFATIPARGAGPQMAGGLISPNVGWKTGPTSCSFTSVAGILGTPFRLPSDMTPNVGWKTSSKQSHYVMYERS